MTGVHGGQPQVPVQAWAAVKATSTPDGVPLAGLGERLLARIVDGLLLSVAQLAAVIPFVPGVLRDAAEYFDTHQQEFDQGTINLYEFYVQTGFLRLSVIFIAVSMVLNAIYTVVFVWRRGATPGKMLTGVRVRPWAAEGRPSWAQSAQRWLSGEFVGAFIGFYTFVNYLWPCWDERKQALHDKWPATVVVTNRR